MTPTRGAARSPRSGGALGDRDRDVGQAVDRGGQRLRARRRLRARARVRLHLRRATRRSSASPRSTSASSPGFGGTQRLARRVGVAQGEGAVHDRRHDRRRRGAAHRPGRRGRRRTPSSLAKVARSSPSGSPRTARSRSPRSSGSIHLGQSTTLDARARARAAQLRPAVRHRGSEGGHDGVPRRSRAAPRSSRGSNVHGLRAHRRAARRPEDRARLRAATRCCRRRPRSIASTATRRSSSKRMAELGFLGIAVPEEYGGAGLDTSSYVLAMEEISRACASTGVIMSVNNSLVVRSDPQVRHRRAEEAVADAARARQDARLLRAVASPRPAATPPRRRRPRRATATAGCINGTKNWITNGPVADVCVLFAMNDTARGPQGHHRVHPADEAPRACAAARPTTSSASAARKSCQIFLDDVRLPDDAAARRGRRRLQGRDVDARRRPHRHRGAGARHRARRARGRARLRAASASTSASRSRSTRRSSSSSPTWRPRSTRRACSRCARRR